MTELAQVLRHVRATSSDPALLVGLDEPDDAAVYRVAPDLAIVQTVDFFTPVVDDPAAWGRIAAANALSDVYAMGGTPVTALNLIGWPRSLGFELLGAVLEGASRVCQEAGVSVVGGHSIDDPEPKFGLAVTGTIHPDRIVRKTGAGPGCDLVLTKPLGSGTISSGIKEGLASAAAIEEVTAVMTELNAAAAAAMAEVGVDAATDVTGFGLIGHLTQMLSPDVSALLDLRDIPVLPDAISLYRQGIYPGGSKRNLEALGGSVTVLAADDGDDAARVAMLFDAQTSGGLLMAVEAARTHLLVEALTERGVRTIATIGRLVDGGGTIEVRG